MASFLVACDSPERFVLKADEGQIGAGTTLTMDGKSGRLHAGPLPGFPQGLDVKVIEIAQPLPTGYLWEVETEQKLKFGFVVAAGKYICRTCDAWGLPVTWHKEKISK